MAFMLMERNAGQSTIDYPLAGSRGIVDALVRGLVRHGGRLRLRTHVDEIIVEGMPTLLSAEVELLGPYV